LEKPVEPAPVGGSSASKSSSPGARSDSNSPSNSPQTAKRATKSRPVNDPVTVRRKLTQLQVKGRDREKIVTLVKEMKQLKLEKTPHAFCFLLRSCFELSAKSWCADNKANGGPSMTKPDGRDRQLVEALRDIVKFVTKNKTDKAKVKELHGAISALGNPDGVLSVTSLNQLVHNPAFSAIPGDVAAMFCNVFPLLEELNQ
jgi:hypothetical protein